MEVSPNLQSAWRMNCLPVEPFQIKRVIRCLGLKADLPAPRPPHLLSRISPEVGKKTAKQLCSAALRAAGGGGAGLWEKTSGCFLLPWSIK